MSLGTGRTVVGVFGSGRGIRGVVLSAGGALVELFFLLLLLLRFLLPSIVFSLRLGRRGGLAAVDCDGSIG